MGDIVPQIAMLAYPGVHRDRRGGARVDRASGAELRDRAHGTHCFVSSLRQARAFLTKEQQAAAGQHIALQWHGARKVVDADHRQRLGVTPLRQLRHVLVIAHMLIAVGHHRTAPIPLAVAHDVHFFSEKRIGSAHDRPDVEVVLPVFDRDVKVVPPVVEVGDHRLASPVAIAVDDVAPVALSEQGGVETYVVRPLADPRPDANLKLVLGHAANPRLCGVHSLAAGVDLTPDLDHLTAASVYVVVLALVFVESGLLVGFFLPGDTVLFAAGLLTADDASGVSLPVLTAGVFISAVAGDSVGYACGSRLGRPWLVARVQRGRLDARHLARAEAFFARFGWFAIVAARWIPWVRTFTPILAGTARMAYARFLSANAVGALTWGVALVVLGHLSASNDRLRTTSYVVAGCFVAGSLVLGAVGWWRRRRSLGAAR
jgi:membrane-associated protein